MDNIYHGDGRLINVDEADDHEIDWHNLSDIGHAWHKYEGNKRYLKISLS